MHRGYISLILVFGIFCVLHGAYAGRWASGSGREAIRLLLDIERELDRASASDEAPSPGRSYRPPIKWKSVGCSSIFMPRSDVKEQDESLAKRCRFMEHQVSLAVLSGKTWPRMSFYSAEAVLEEFRQPTQNYTILMPPHSELYKLDVAVMSGQMDRDKVTNSMLKHIIPGTHSVEDFLAMPKGGNGYGYNGKPLETMSGDNLLFHWDKSGLQRIVISSMNNRLLAILDTPETPSCKQGSRILQISRVLQDLEVVEILAEQDRNVETTELQRIEDNSSKVSGPHIVREQPEPSRNDGSADPEPSNPKLPKNAPKKLYRLDTQRWSTKPVEVAKVAPSSKKRSSSDKKTKQPSAPKPLTASGTRRSSASFSVQKSYPSTGVDTVGLKRDHACVICFEKEGDHVLLPCGHGGYCGSCAHTLLYQPNKSRLCPICRARLGSIAKVDLNTAIGAPANVLEASVGLVEPSSESVELRQWQALMRSTWNTPAHTFPPENDFTAARGQAIPDGAGDARAEGLAAMVSLVANGHLPPFADGRAITQ